MKSPANSDKVVEARFLAALRRHLAGWRKKVTNDFSSDAYDKELAQLVGDSLYPQFGFARPEYVFIRLMGRMSISIGRRLGEIYDKIPRFVAAAKFGLPLDKIAPKMKNLELDIGIRFADISSADKRHIKKIIRSYTRAKFTGEGIGIEIRYNFNPNDSSRLRKDCDMAGYLLEEGLFPIYLVFSAISPRDEAIARLKRAGWTFLVGQDASRFSNELFGLNLGTILEQDKIRQEITEEIGALFDDIFSSHAFTTVMKHRVDQQNQPRSK
jgi:hypothetical protein